MPKNVRRRMSTRRRARTPMRKPRRAASRRKSVSRRAGTLTRSTGLQRYNRGTQRSFTVVKSVPQTNIATTAGGVGYIYHPQTGLLPNYAVLVTQFRKLRVNWIKMRFELQTLEATDDSVMPAIYWRSNQDPDQGIPTTATSMLTLPGTVKKTFTATATIFEATFRPKVMVAGIQSLPGAVFAPMPKTMPFVDATHSLTMYGAMYFIAAAGLNQSIGLTIETSVTWNDPM